MKPIASASLPSTTAVGRVGWPQERLRERGAFLGLVAGTKADVFLAHLNAARPEFLAQPLQSMTRLD